MKNLGGTLRPGPTTRLVFVFEQAGRIPVDALVHASSDPSLPALGCRVS